MADATNSAPGVGEAAKNLAEIAAAVEFAPGDGLSFREVGAVKLAADIRAVLAALSRPQPGPTREALKAALGCIQPRIIPTGRGGVTIGLGMDGVDEAADRVFALFSPLGDQPTDLGAFRADALHTQPGAEQAVLGLEAIARQVERWASFDREARDREGLTTTDDTHIVAPPVWPTHGQLRNWAGLLREVGSRLSALNPTEREDGPWVGWQPIETAPKDGTRIFVWADGYEWPEVVEWLPYDARIAEDAGEAGFWTYAETLLADATDSCGSEYWSHWMPLLPAPSASPSPEGGR